MILFLSTLVYATSVGIFPLQLLPKNIKQNTHQQEVQDYIQLTLLNLSSGSDLEVVSEKKLVKRLEGTDDYYEILFR